MESGWTQSEDVEVADDGLLVLARVLLQMSPQLRVHFFKWIA
jgi:hypothetical protein